VHVEIDALSDLFHVERGEIRLTRKLRLVAKPDLPPRALRARVAGEAHAGIAAPDSPGDSPPQRPHAIEMLPTATRWSEVTITLVDEATISVGIGQRFRRVRYDDLGLDHTQSRKPTKAWDLLVLCCRGGGTFSWRKLGSFDNARRVVSRLRQTLRDKFGIAEDPFHPYETGAHWKTRFVARSELD
jgi:hypothetical protein